MQDYRLFLMTPDRCYYVKRDGDTIEINLTKCEKGIDIGLNIDKNVETWLHPVEIAYAKLLEESF